MKIFNKLLMELEAEKESRALGRGWVSGFLSLLLSTIAAMTLLCFLLPGLFTTPEIRSAINVSYIRIALEVTLTFGFVFACVSLMLRENKIMGMLSILLIFISLAVGGAHAHALAQVKSGVYFGMDWFIINLILSGLFFIPLERLFRRVDQSMFRREWREDLLYFFVSSLMVQSLTFLSLFPSNVLKEIINFPLIASLIKEQPMLLQLLEIMFFTDFIQYWFHRGMHQVPFFWRFHSIHHSAKSMDWLAASRMHVLEIIVLRGVTVIPMQLFGFSHMAIYAYLILVYFYSTYIHANLKFNIEWLKPLIVTPRFHHWHHGVGKEAVNVNFAIHFPILDRAFGTYYMPKKRWPASYGIGGDQVPVGFYRQFIEPLSKKKK